MRRLLIDLVAVVALLAPLEFELLPHWAGLVGLLAIPIVLSFFRGVVERRFLRRIPLWRSIAEWCFILLATGVIACIPGPRSDPHDQFLVTFGFFWFLFIAPSTILGAISFVFGTHYGAKRSGTPEPSI